MSRKITTVDQHPPLRPPVEWRGEARSLVAQIDLLISQIYGRLGEIEKRLKKLEEEE